MTLRMAAVFCCLATSAWAAEYPAVLGWSQRVDLATGVPGVVDSVPVQPGQTVARNALLLALHPAVYQAGVAEAQADIARQVEEEAEARRDLERVKELYARTVSSTTELDAAKLRHARANALLTAGQAKLERARRQLLESEVRAPFEAVVLARRAEPGMVVATQCQPPQLLTVARADEMLAVSQVEAGQAAGLALGTAAGVSAGGRSYAGKVRAITARADGKYGVEVAFPRPAGLLAGQAATVRLP
jgi:RND family efflux transporter MFP subunit